MYFENENKNFKKEERSKDLEEIKKRIGKGKASNEKLLAEKCLFL